MVKRTTVRNTQKLLLGLVLLTGMFWITGQMNPAKADPPIQEGTVTNTPPLQQDDGPNVGPDSNCLMCHADPELTGKFGNGELMSLYVDSNKYERSVHGPAGLECLACHTEISSYPHHVEEQVTCVACHPAEGGEKDTEYAALKVQLAYYDRREMTLALNESCGSCHEQEFDIAGDSAHVAVLEGGNRDAPVCVDCHGDHNIEPSREPRSKISHICGNCHRAVYSTYRTSIHGTALDHESNPDVPTCTDCHGVHSVRGPRDSAYRNDSITICGGCHANQEMMDKYGISTNVFDTYLDDFHGRTVDFFRRQKSGVPSNKAVCFDCHGIHNIRQADDPLSTIYPANLQHTCQQCHVDANITFPRAWVSHYLPTWEDTPILYVINLAYQVLVPVLIGGFVLYIGLDAGRRWYDKRQMIHQILAEEELEDYEFTDDV